MNLYCVRCGDGDSLAGVSVTNITDPVAAEISLLSPVDLLLGHLCNLLWIILCFCK